MRIRVIGTPDEVDLAIEALDLTPLMGIERVSRPYACRRDGAGLVRVYMTVRALSQLPTPGAAPVAPAHSLETWESPR
ncbi:MAG: hypothetical protein HKP61_21935 [Dactylosporangium sp.]|nr:hypothetical protein [Dactylosporangium sp.]NNJ63541.1 hypothetical protein [Dactylosporangium sp.]